MSGVTTATVLTAASLAATVAGGVVSYEGAQEAAKAQKNASLYQAQVAQNNASVANQNAQIATQAGAAQAEQQELKTRAAVGAIKASQGASGIDVNSGSALDTQKSQDVLGQLDALSIRSNAARQAYGYQNQAASYEGEAALDRSGASAATEAGNIAGTSSLLSAASSAGNTYNQYQLLSGTGKAPSATFIGDNAPNSQTEIMTSLGQ